MVVLTPPRVSDVLLFTFPPTLHKGKGRTYSPNEIISLKETPFSHVKTLLIRNPSDIEGMVLSCYHLVNLRKASFHPVCHIGGHLLYDDPVKS